MSSLSVKNVSMSFDTQRGQYHALSNVNLEVRDGEFVCLIGHSGCGKSTLLNLIAGLVLPTSGAITSAGVPVVAPGPDRSMVFQNHALLPWLSCFDNVLLGVANVLAVLYHNRHQFIFQADEHVRRRWILAQRLFDALRAKPTNETVDFHFDG